MYNRQQPIDIIKSIDKKRRIYTNQIYPDIELTENDNYIITTYQDRLDLLAFDFYGDDSLWIVIATANALPGDSLYPPIGVQLRIPSNPNKFMSDYATINRIR